MFQEDFSYAMEHSPRALVLASLLTKRLTYWNQTATSVYGINEKTYSLEEIFTLCPQTLQERIKFMLDSYSTKKPYAFFPDVLTLNVNGEEQLADLLIGYLNDLKDEIFMEFTPKLDNRESVTLKQIDESEKPMFLAQIDENLSIYHANDSFYHLFADSQEEFEKFFQNNLISALQCKDGEKFTTDLEDILQSQVDFQQDIKIINASGQKQMIYLHIQFLPVGQGQFKLKGTIMPLDTVKKNETEIAKPHPTHYYELVQNLTSGTLFYINPETKTVSHHNKNLEVFGLPKVMDHFPDTFLPMIHPEDQEKFLTYTARLLRGKEENCEILCINGSDEFVNAKITALNIKDEQGKLQEIIGKVEILDDEEFSNRKTFDPLTNALKKEYVQETVDKILKESHEGASHAMIFLDLDDFKKVGETHGLDYSNYVLTEFGRRMYTCVRGDDLIGRIGVDQFILLIKNIPSFEMVKRKSKQLLEAIAKDFDDGNQAHTIGGSMGISIYPDHGTNYKHLNQYAEIALSRSKNRGKNMATIYRPPIPQKKDENTSEKSEPETAVTTA